MIGALKHTRCCCCRCPHLCFKVNLKKWMFLFSYVNSRLLSCKYKACRIDYPFHIMQIQIWFLYIGWECEKNFTLGIQLNKMYISMQTDNPVPSYMQWLCVRMTSGSSILPLILLITIPFFVLLKNCLQFLFTFLLWVFDVNFYDDLQMQVICMSCKLMSYPTERRSKVCWRRGTLEPVGRGILLGVTVVSPSVYNCVKHFRTIANFNFAKPAFVRR